MKKIVILSSFVAMLLLSGCGDSMNSEQEKVLKEKISKMSEAQKIDGYGEAFFAEDKQKMKIYESSLKPEQVKKHNDEIQRLKLELTTMLVEAQNPNATRSTIKHLANTYEQFAFNPKIQNWNFYKNEFKPAAEKILGIQPQGK